MQDKSPLNMLLTWLVAGILFVIALKVAFIVLGVAAALLSIAVRILPVVLAVWLVWMVIRWLRKDPYEPEPL